VVEQKAAEGCFKWMCVSDWLINDIYKGLVNKLLKFANDTKFVGVLIQ